jgi:ubiquinone/menaquinone biosynthesis C-methylase UbiE
MHNHPSILGHKMMDEKAFDQLKMIINKEGAGKQDVIGRREQQSKSSESNKWTEYEYHVERKHAMILVPFIERYMDIRDQLILDFGSGTGGSSVALSAKDATVIGVEPIYANFLAANLRARMYGLNNKAKFFYTPETKNLPFRESSFDACIANSVFQCIVKERNQYISELWRVLKKGGLLFITDTSNGIYPVEMHTKRWFINYKPKRAIRDKCIRGMPYWEILGALRGHAYTVMNLRCNKDDLYWYFHKLGFPVRGRKKVIYYFFLGLEKVLSTRFSTPISAFLPWMNIVVRKEDH